jgi:hypothetical protein
MILFVIALVGVVQLFELQTKELVPQFLVDVYRFILYLYLYHPVLFLVCEFFIFYLISEYFSGLLTFLQQIIRCTTL